MGMFLTKYSMLKALGYNEEGIVLEETKRMLKPFKLIGLILHDPNNHKEFHAKFAQSFESLDLLTGRDFLFFGLTDPPDNWLEKNNRDSFSIWEPEKLLNPANAYETLDESITAFTIAQSLGIEYDSLPVIILTNNFQFNQYRVVKTCQKHLEQQLIEIGNFCSQKQTIFNLIEDAEFNRLIHTIDLCGGSSHIKNEESLAKTLSDYLSFVIKEDYKSIDNRIAQNHSQKILNKFFSINLRNNIRESRDIYKSFPSSEDNKSSYNLEQSIPNRINYEDEYYLINENQKNISKKEKLNLFILGCLSNFKKQQRNIGITNVKEDILEIDTRCENESKIILNTFNRVFSSYSTNTNPNEFEGMLDYSPLIMSLGKIFEIEVNLSVVHWIRNLLNIEMPEYYKKHKNDKGDYKLIPSESIIYKPRPVDFNMGTQLDWHAPGLGESELITKTLYSQKKTPPGFTDVESFLRYWTTIRQLRNKAAHTECLYQNDFSAVHNAFTSLVTTGKFGEMNNLKIKYKQ